MRLGILSDTHNELRRTRVAVQMLQDAGAEALIHCGDLASAPIVAACSVLPFWFVFGNHDVRVADELRQAAIEYRATCLELGCVIELAGRRIGVAHGHSSDITRVRNAQPDFLLSGHTHVASDVIQNNIRRINPGALQRASEYTVAVLDLATEILTSLTVAR
ncbi:YfcE family phosphodiesterase [bacterium]|nr:YfcE family phosphodiesterase [bacterium]